MEKRPVFCFDIDGTFFRWQLGLCWMEELATTYPHIRELLNDIQPLFRGYKRREVTFHEFVNAYVQKFWHEKRFKGINVHDAIEAARVAAEKHGGRTYVFTRELLRAATDLGYVTVAISGSPQEAVEAYVEPYGVDAVLAVRHTVKDGRYVDGPLTDPVRGKGDALRSFLRERPDTDADHVIVIGDSPPDASMLKLARWPICFNPNQELQDNAREYGWHIVLEVRNTYYILTQGQVKFEEHRCGLNGILPPALADNLDARLRNLNL